MDPKSMSLPDDSHLSKRYSIIREIGKGAYGVVYKARDVRNGKIVAIKRCIGVFQNEHDAQRSEIGKGAYGVVYKARDVRNGKIVAIKRCIGVFQNEHDAQRSYREIYYLRLLKHINVIPLLNIHKSSNPHDLYLVFPYMAADLHSVIRHNIMQEQHIEYVSYQMFLAVSFLHSGGLLHRDLKPSNILIGSDSIIKICDFGLARALVKTESSADFPAALMTDYIATRWFRSPELLLGDKNYDAAIDIWSLGCIIAEMFLQKPLFPGHSTLNQLALILKVIGHPTDEEIHACGSPHARTMLDALPDCVRKASRVTHGFSHISPAESPSLASIKEKGRPCLVRPNTTGIFSTRSPPLYSSSSSSSSLPDMSSYPSNY
ncbi:Extracellular signal-regulated kinase 2, partial [Aduncisulcus paluster]